MRRHLFHRVPIGAATLLCLTGFTPTWSVGDPVIEFAGQRFALCRGPSAFESVAYDPELNHIASKGSIYDACGNRLSDGPDENPGLAWDPVDHLYWQITSDRRVRRWSAAGALVDTVFTIPLTFSVPSSGPDTLESPRGIALDGTHVYVVDAGPDPGEISSNAWFKFTRAGAPVKASRSTDFTAHLDADPDALVDDIVYVPASCPILPGKLLVALEHSGIQIIDTDGAFAGRFRWSTQALPTGVKLAAFAGLAIDPALGNLYLVDNDQSAIQVWVRLPATDPTSFFTGCNGEQGYLQSPTARCNLPLWRPFGTPNGIFGIAFRTLDARVYGFDYTSGVLWRWDPRAGQAEIVDATGLPNQWGLAYDPMGDDLYAAEQLFGNARIHRVDPDTGADTPLANQVGFAIEELAFDTNDRKLYAVSSVSGQFKLIRIDRTSGIGTIVGNTQRVRGMDFDPATDRIVGLGNAPAKLWSIDPTTGSATLLGSPTVDAGWEGLAVIPLQPLPLAVSGSSPGVAIAPVRAAPNPSRAGTTFAFDVPEPGTIIADVYDASGRLVRSLTGGYGAAGSRVLAWDHADAQGQTVAPGTYLVRVVAPGYRRVVKVVKLP